VHYNTDLYFCSSTSGDVISIGKRCDRDEYKFKFELYVKTTDDNYVIPVLLFEPSGMGNKSTSLFLEEPRDKPNLHHNGTMYLSGMYIIRASLTEIFSKDKNKFPGPLEESVLQKSLY